MLTFIFSHNFKKTVRSLIWHRELASKIVTSIILLLFAVNLLSIGLFIDQLLNAAAKGQNHLEIINGLLVYYFLFDFLLRLFFQKIPGIIIQPYLLLPVSRNSLLRLLLIKTLMSPFNYFPLLVLIPISIKIVYPVFGLTGLIVWLSAIMFIVVISNFLHFLLQKMQIAKSAVIPAVLIMIFGFIALGKVGIFDISAFSSRIFGYLLIYPFIAVVPLVALIIIYSLNLLVLKKFFYLENYGDYKFSGAGESRSFGFFEKFGEIGTYISLELKLLLRNKRSKSSLMMTVMVLFIVPLYYTTTEEVINPYPLPDKEELASIRKPSIQDYECAVTFHLEAGNLPEKSHVYVTGNQPVFGPWQPDVFPMTRQKDKSWERTFAFTKGVEVEFILTLGSWQNEMKLNDGISPYTINFKVNGDTTITVANPNWGIPRRETFFDVFIIYMGLLFTGFLILIYGQFIFCWESSYFDLITSLPVNIYNYIYSKWIIMLASGFIFSLLNTVTLLFSAELFLINTLLFLYNVGVNALLIIFWASLSRKRFDLNESILSTQGKGGTQFSTILPTFILPILIYLPFAFMGKHIYGFYLFGLIGLLGLIFHKPILKLAVKFFHTQRYKMAAGFRQK